MKISDILKVAENEFGSIVNDGVTAGDVCGWVDSGSYALNALLSGSLYGGFPGNKIVGIGADSGTGKTFFALGTLKNFLDQNLTGIGIILESESAITKKMMVDRGIDVKRVIILPVATVEAMRNQALKIVENHEKIPVKDRVPLFFILDSLGMLSTEKEMTDTVEGKNTKDMTRAGLLKGAFRVLTLRLGRANIPFIVTNHTYDDVGGGPYASKKQSGGSGLIYASSSILGLSKAKEKDAKTNEVYGVILTVTNIKSRLTRENLKIKCMVRYDTGLDRYYYLAELAEQAGVFKKVSTKYQMPDGTTAFEKHIYKNPEKFFTPEVLAKIEEYVQAKFTYGRGDEESDEEEMTDE